MYSVGCSLYVMCIIGEEQRCFHSRPNRVGGTLRLDLRLICPDLQSVLRIKILWACCRPFERHSDYTLSSFEELLKMLFNYTFRGKIK